MAVSPTVKLNNGMDMPVLGLGTWQADVEGECAAATKLAIDVGYRHFDCAMIYGNEKEIGAAIREKIKDGTVQRKDLFITTKLWNDSHNSAVVAQTCKKSLENFGLEYLDLYLMHWPCGYTVDKAKAGDAIFTEHYTPSEHSFVEAWKGMEECIKLGLTKAIGVSNFNKRQLIELLNSATIKPVVNQIEVHPNLNQKKLISFCKERGINVVGYSPLGSPTRPWRKPDDPVVRLDDPKLVEIGKKYGKNAAQVILRYLVQNGVLPIPKSTNRDRLKANIEIFDFSLNADEMAVIDKYDCNGRICAALELRKHPEYPFNDDY